MSQPTPLARIEAAWNDYDTSSIEAIRIALLDESSQENDEEDGIPVLSSGLAFVLEHNVLEFLVVKAADSPERLLPLFASVVALKGRVLNQSGVLLPLKTLIEACRKSNDPNLLFLLNQISSTLLQESGQSAPLIFGTDLGSTIIKILCDHLPESQTAREAMIQVLTIPNHDVAASLTAANFSRRVVDEIAGTFVSITSMQDSSLIAHARLVSDVCRTAPLPIVTELMLVFDALFLDRVVEPALNADPASQAIAIQTVRILLMNSGPGPLRMHLFRFLWRENHQALFLRQPAFCLNSLRAISSMMEIRDQSILKAMFPVPSAGVRPLSVEEEVKHFLKLRPVAHASVVGYVQYLEDAQMNVMEWLNQESHLEQLEQQSTELLSSLVACLAPHTFVQMHPNAIMALTGLFSRVFESPQHHIVDVALGKALEELAPVMAEIVKGRTHRQWIAIQISMGIVVDDDDGEDLPVKEEEDVDLMRVVLFDQWLLELASIVEARGALS